MGLKKMMVLICLCSMSFVYGQSLDFRIGDLNLGAATFNNSTCIQVPVMMKDLSPNRSFLGMALTLRIDGDLEVIDLTNGFMPFVSNAYVGTLLSNFEPGIRNPPVDLANVSQEPSTECNEIVNQAVFGGDEIDFPLGDLVLGGSWSINNNFDPFVMRGSVFSAQGSLIATTTGDDELVAVLEIPIVQGLSGLSDARITITAEPGVNFNGVIFDAEDFTPFLLGPGYEGIIDICTTPGISSHPVGTTVCQGERVEMSVETVQVGMSYQWFRDGVAVEGQTGATLVLEAAAFEEAGSYHVEVTGCGRVTVASNATGMTVFEPAAFAVQPANTNSCEG